MKKRLNEIPPGGRRALRINYHRPGANRSEIQGTIWRQVSCALKQGESEMTELPCRAHKIGRTRSSLPG